MVSKIQIVQGAVEDTLNLRETILGWTDPPYMPEDDSCDAIHYLVYNSCGELLGCASTGVRSTPKDTLHLPGTEVNALTGVRVWGFAVAEKH